MIFFCFNKKSLTGFAKGNLQYKILQGSKASKAIELFFVSVDFPLNLLFKELMQR
jgi:hypothetical protein